MHSGQVHGARGLVGTWSAELTQEEWPVNRFQWASMPLDALNPLCPVVLVDAIARFTESVCAAPSQSCGQGLLH